MSAGIPLSDGDRWDWLISLCEAGLKKLKGGESSVVITCSALKRKYRDIFRLASWYDRRVQVHFIFLSTSETVLKERVKRRKAHLMKESMVQSQLSDMELPDEDEEQDVLFFDVSGSEEVVNDEVVRAVLSYQGKR